MKKMLFILCIILSAAAAAFADEQMRIAILDLTPQGVDEQTASAVSEILRSSMINSSVFIVIERTQVDAILDVGASDVVTTEK